MSAFGGATEHALPDLRTQDFTRTPTEETCADQGEDEFRSRFARSWACRRSRSRPDAPTMTTRPALPRRAAAGARAAAAGARAAPPAPMAVGLMPAMPAMPR